MSDTSKLYVLVVAHPDDESMFFLPTIRGLQSEDATLWILCLTTGDYDGLGKIREKEMHNAGRLLGIKKVIVGDNLKDHPKERWPASLVKSEISSILSREITASGLACEEIVFLSFDQYGVSGHVNHIDTCFAVQALAKQGEMLLSSPEGAKKELSVQAWQLVSERNLVKKYLPVLCWCYLILSFFITIAGLQMHTSEAKIYRLSTPGLNWNAMRTHQSQFVWYRRLFIVFSCYTYVNELRKV